MLGHRLRRWPSIGPTLDRCIVFARIYIYVCFFQLELSQVDMLYSHTPLQSPLVNRLNDNFGGWNLCHHATKELYQCSNSVMQPSKYETMTECCCNTLQQHRSIQTQVVDPCNAEFNARPTSQRRANIKSTLVQHCTFAGMGSCLLGG